MAVSLNALQTCIEVSCWNGKVTIDNTPYPPTHPQYADKKRLLFDTIGRPKLIGLITSLLNDHVWLDALECSSSEGTWEARRDIENILTLALHQEFES